MSDIYVSQPMQMLHCEKTYQPTSDHVPLCKAGQREDFACVKVASKKVLNEAHRAAA